MNIKAKLAQIEKSLDEIRHATGDYFRVVIKKADETKEEGLARHGLIGNEPGLTVILVRFCDGRQPGFPLYEKLAAEESEPKPSLVEIDAELEQLQSELKKETQ